MTTDTGSLAWLSLEEASRRIRTRELSPVELTRDVLSRIERLDPRLHAFLTVDADGAMVAARRAEAEIARGHVRGPLHGIPVSLKDCFFTRSMRTTAASRIYRDWTPRSDAAVVERLAQAGAIVLGKANMFELATGWGTTGFFPLAINPWDEGRTPGGSSSGSAVAVATGMGYASVGTDGGGSVRVPANYSGVTGAKPTYGTVSSFGTIPVGPSVSHVGAIARSVIDAEIVLSVLRGHDERDPSSMPVQRIGSMRRRRSLRGIRIGVPRWTDGDRVTDDVAASFDEAMSVLRSGQARIVEVDVPDEKRVAAIWTTIVYAELAAFHEENLGSDEDGFGPELRQRLEAGLATRAVEYYRAQEARASFRSEYLAILRDVDILATPTAPGPPPTLAELTARSSDLQDVGQLARFTRPHNLTGFPAISVPAGATAEGLPLGLQLAGRPLEDVHVWSVADWFQTHTRWHLRRPPAAA